MNSSRELLRFSQTLIALAVIGTVSPARAADEPDITALAAPENSVSVGVGAASGNSKDRALFGTYNGLRRDDVNLLLDLNYLKADQATGRWTAFEARNLGLDNRELRFTTRQLGDWKFGLEYSELVKHDPRTINTGLTAPGSTTPTVNVLAATGTGAEFNPELKRKSIGLSGDKWILGSLQFEANFKNEDKDGSRLFGRGFACASASTMGTPPAVPTGCAAAGYALLLLPEPINSNIKQLDTKFNFLGDKFLLTGGYYGSFYTNSYGTLTPTVPGALLNGVGVLGAVTPALLGVMRTPMALPPDNQAHQLYLSGNYRFTRTTQSTFKLAYTHATQNESFAAMGLAAAPAGRPDLGAVVDTKLAQFGVTSRPMPKLSLLANLRYEDKNDKTPVALYNNEYATAGTVAAPYTNNPLSLKKLVGKLEGSYQFADKYRGTLGADYESIDRGVPLRSALVGQATGVYALRQVTRELGLRAELRRAMSETLSGAVSFMNSRRDGSSWLGGTTGLPIADACVGASCPTPVTLTDRTRNVWRLSTDWAPTERASLQVRVDNGRDDYAVLTGPGTIGKGNEGEDFRAYALDAVWMLSGGMRLTGYISRMEQVRDVNHSTGYNGDYRDITDSAGLGLTGKASARLLVGADASYINETNRYAQLIGPPLTAANQALLATTGGLPDIKFRQLRLKFFADYAVQKNAHIRLDVIHQRSYMSDYAWGYNGVPFFFSDNTTVTTVQQQNVTFVGAKYIYKFQ